MSARSPIIITPSDSGEVLRAFGEEIIVHLGGDQTGGKVCMFTETTPPGGGPPPHYHHDQDAWFYLSLIHI